MEWIIAIVGVIVGGLGYGMLLISARLLDQTMELLKNEKERLTTASTGQTPSGSAS